MIKVFQDKFGVKNGNCMQAAIASLLELPLESVPHFYSYGDDWFQHLYSFLKKYGYDFHGTPHNAKMLGYWGDDRFDEIKKDKEKYIGVDGLFYAVVYSPNNFDRIQFICNRNYFPPTHAVIIDRDFNIVHDPNPDYQGIKQYPLHEWLEYNGVVEVYLIEKIV